ncbi:MAG: hypothetical protein PWQ97_333 [Tepidanaerobacteraceae bacterium]|nr:hypothetical protein [Tepidanaerobacteraceae bacterium]
MFIADFHIHSKYSRATSGQCNPETLEMWARRKGIDVVGTGDFTHPAWREELKNKLVPSGEGLYVLKDDFRIQDEVAKDSLTPQFIVSGEISSIYKKNGRVRKVHNLIILPSLEEAESLSRRLEAVGNLHSDGRPILGLDSRVLLEMVLEVCPDAIFIPAHIWTPHFSLYGAYSGFDDIRECFEDLTGYISALETGLSSNPPMNWRLSALDGFTLVSNSDAHSPMNLGREANVFDAELSYRGILRALKGSGTDKFHGTIEFFPEEGKYHYDGHRKCNVCWSPADTIAAGGKCPVCGGKITVGVLHRVESLADRPEGFKPSTARPFESLVPLHEVIASSIGSSASSVKVKRKYEDMIRNLGPEFYILRKAPLKDIELLAGPYIAEGIRRLRCGEIEIKPGYDGEYGKIKIMDKNEINMLSGQLCLINDKCTNAKGAIPGSIENKKISTDKAESAQFLVDCCAPSDSMDAVKTAPSDILYGLNQEQWEAVSASCPAMAVIAGPGTGKTKTLICRIAYLIEKCGVNPSCITAVTFTNKAANEMRTRLKEHFGEGWKASAVNIGTFHSICLQLLSKWKDATNLTIIDEYTAVSIVEEILKNLKLRISPWDVLRGISLIKNGIAGAKDSKSNIPADVYDSYCSQLKRYGLMDYDDILIEVLRRFEDNNTLDIPESGEENCFSHLLVDEFQDINDIQYHLIKEWGKKSKSVFFIGDPDQCIYGFRGSDFRFFERLKQDFPGIRYVRLTQNYRSTPEIIASAKSVISKKTAAGETCPLYAKRESGSKVRLIKASDEFAEAVFIAKEINRMVGGIDMLDAHALSGPGKKRPATRHTRGFSDIAVLYRTNRQAEILEQCLSKEGIQYVVAGRDEFLSEKPVRKAIAFFRFLLNPSNVASLLLYLKTENIYSEDLDQKVLKSYAAGEKSVLQLIRLMEKTELVLQEAAKLQHFTEMLRKYEPIVHKEKPEKIITSWINDNSTSGLKCMELLLNTAVMYDKMSSFIQNLVLGRESDVMRSGSKAYCPDAVWLMTIHAAKGLEFPTVFIYGANDGIIPLKSSSSRCYDIDEERRLFYVGMTRAQEELILVTSRTPSLFIGDISEEQLIIENAFPQKQARQYKQASLFDM